MKLNIIKYITLSGALLLTACSSDFLETSPTDKIGTETVFESTTNAKLAINGIAKLMTTQYMSQGYNGEGTIKMYYGNYPGNHFMVDHSSRTNHINGNYHENSSSTYTYYPWHYYYKLIANANAVIHNIDDASGPQSERDFIKAQALTYRAYSYTMLAQLYGNRWSDSNNGETKAVVLRLLPDSESMPLSSLKEVYAQVYEDLDFAISLFASSKYSRKDNFEIDATVAKAVYARAAITKQDYPTAIKYAAEARASYPLMGVADYTSGFANPTSEWIWSSYGAIDETLHYYSYFAYIAYNSATTNARTYQKRISKELYDQVPATDIRRDMFLDPEGFEINENTGAAGKELTAHAYERFPDIAKSTTVHAHMQFKIKANDLPGVGHLNHFRSSEMLLIEAEARYFVNPADAKVAALLEELTKSTLRDPEYAVTATGTALLDEIKKYRAIELWAEGFDWFDMKRWGDAIDRKGVKDGGNFRQAVAVKIEPEDKNNWVWTTPQKELDYNDQI